MAMYSPPTSDNPANKADRYPKLRDNEITLNLWSNWWQLSNFFRLESELLSSIQIISKSSVITLKLLMHLIKSFSIIYSSFYIGMTTDIIKIG